MISYIDCYQHLIVANTDTLEQHSNTDRKINRRWMWDILSAFLTFFYSWDPANSLVESELSRRYQWGNLRAWNTVWREWVSIYHQSRALLCCPFVILISPQAYDDYLDDVLSLDLGTEPVSEKSLHSTNMLDFLVKEEPLGEDDLKALQKDRQKKDNHNMSENIFLSSPDFCLQQDSNNFILWASNGQ